MFPFKNNTNILSLLLNFMKYITEERIFFSKYLIINSNKLERRRNAYN